MTKDRQTVIDELLKWLGEPCVQVTFVTQTKADNIAARYFDAAKNVLDDDLVHLEENIRSSVEKNGLHGHIRSWKRCCACTLDMLLHSKSIDGRHRIRAAGAIVRLSQYVYTPDRFFGAFSGAAGRIADCIWGPGFIQNEAAGELSLDDSLVDDNGLIRLWKLAQGLPDAGRSDEDTNYMASRLLIFLCEKRYADIYIDQADAEYLDAIVDKDEHVLTRWSTKSKHVRTIAERISVRASAILQFLEWNEFYPGEGYNADADTRFEWFRNDWNVIEHE